MIRIAKGTVIIKFMSYGCMVINDIGSLFLAKKPDGTIEIVRNYSDFPKGTKLRGIFPDMLGEFKDIQEFLKVINVETLSGITFGEMVPECIFYHYKYIQPTHFATLFNSHVANASKKPLVWIYLDYDNPSNNATFDNKKDAISYIETNSEVDRVAANRVREWNMYRSGSDDTTWVYY